MNVMVYRDFERAGKRFRGSASVRVHPTHGGRDMRRILRQAAGAALWVDNAHYPLVGPGGALSTTSGPAGPPNLNESLELLARALQDSGEGEGSRLNSAELFVENAEVRIRNSEGLDVRFPQTHVYCELIVESDGSAGKVELHKALESRNIGPDSLQEEVQRLQRLCRDRAAAGRGSIQKSSDSSATAKEPISRPCPRPERGGSPLRSFWPGWACRARSSCSLKRKL